MTNVAYNPDAIMTIIAVVEKGQPEPSMGRDKFVWLVFESTNAQMMEAIRSKALEGQIETRFEISEKPSSQSTEEYVIKLIKHEVDQGASACIQCQDVKFVQGTGPNYATLVTVFKTGSGQKQIIAVSEGPMSQNENGCFIATAAYGSSREVQELRYFRDNFLSNTILGSLLCKAYYRCSPSLARLISKHVLLRRFTQLMLIPIVLMIQIANKQQHQKYKTARTNPISSTLNNARSAEFNAFQD